MTIVAGFKTTHGIVLCADTQETVGGISKRNVPKLRYEPSLSGALVGLTGQTEQDILATAFCGATDNGPYLDMLIDQAWKNARNANSFEEACALIRCSIKDTYREYRGIYQSGQMPSTEIIYGVKMEGQSKLFYALGPAISESDSYLTGGVGSYLADFIAARMYDRYMSIRQCVIVAAYVLFQAKEHVEGCGGDSHIAVLRDDDTSGIVAPDNVRSATKLVEIADKTLGEILIHYADMALTKEEFVKKAYGELDQLMSVREFEIDKFRENKEIWDGLFGMRLHDEIGLPSSADLKPSDDRTLED